MRKIHIYYIIFLINVINLFFRLYYKKFLQITTFYKIENMDQLNSMTKRPIMVKFNSRSLEADFSQVPWPQIRNLIFKRN